MENSPVNNYSNSGSSIQRIEKKKFFQMLIGNIIAQSLYGEQYYIHTQCVMFMSLTVKYFS